jgi:hypothetical protein
VLVCVCVQVCVYLCVSVNVRVYTCEILVIIVHMLHIFS